MVSGTRLLSPADVARATAELILALQSEFPSVRITPCESIEGEDIHLEATMHGADDEQVSAAQERAIELKQIIEDTYGIYALVRVNAL